MGTCNMLSKILKNRKRRVMFLSILLTICVLVAYAGYYVIASRLIKYNGKELIPSKDYPIHEVTYYLQNDPHWSGDNIGNSSYTMGGAGCLITCVASSICDLGVSITPQELNHKLAAIDGFDDAILLWYKIHEAVPEADYKYSRIFSSRTIEKDLREGRLPIINVKYRGGGITHWLLVVGAKDGEFMVYDPLNQDKEPIPLSTHGKVYAYRVLVKGRN